MGLWFAPALAVYLPSTLDDFHSELYSSIQDGAGNENPYPDVAASEANFAAAAGELNPLSRGGGHSTLIAMLRGAYDEDTNTYYKQTQFMSDTGTIISAGTSVNTTDNGLPAFANENGGDPVFDIRPNSSATSDNTILLPFAIASPSHGTQLALWTPTGAVGPFGCNGLNGGTPGVYASQGVHYAAGASSPSVPNLAKEVRLWLEVNQTLGYFQTPGVFLAKGGDGLAFSSGISGSYGNTVGRALNGYGGWFEENDYHGSLATPMDKTALSGLASIAPGDYIPMCIMLMGKNADLSVTQAFSNLPNSILTALKVRMEFAKVDPVPAAYEATIKAAAAGWSIA